MWQDVNKELAYGSEIDEIPCTPVDFHFCGVLECMGGKGSRKIK
jgi:hypothetical protein